VIPVERSPRSEAKSAPIFLGRSRKCQIVIRHSSVSKLHAVLHAPAAGPYTLTDAGSNNGTSIGDHQLTPNVPAELRPGDIVLFGTVPARVLDAAGLHETFTRLFPSSP